MRVAGRSTLWQAKWRHLRRQGWVSRFRTNNPFTCWGSEQRWLASLREVIGVTAGFSGAGYKWVVAGALPAWEEAAPWKPFVSKHLFRSARSWSLPISRRFPGPPCPMPPHWPANMRPRLLWRTRSARNRTSVCRWIRCRMKTIRSGWKRIRNLRNMFSATVAG